MTHKSDHPDHLSRREFLRLCAMGSLALGSPPLSEEERFLPGQKGRVTEAFVEVHAEPSAASPVVDKLWRDQVFDVVSAMIGDSQPAHNRVWYEADGQGYVHSSNVQPVREAFNEPLAELPEAGMLMEVSVAFVEARWKPRPDGQLAYRFYFGSTHWVTGVSQDVAQTKWYRIQDDKYDYVYFAEASAFRPIPAEELAPLSPQVPPEEKRVVVDLSRQWLYCYEASRMVHATKVSTGRGFGGVPFWTPQGSFITFRKRASRHMSAGNLASGYDLPGVPWCCYITENGVAFHGTYWHNDYGVPRSHGCINMTPEAAKWLYRWTTPVVPAEEQEVWVNYGTQADIHA